jgi:hypothetical protein
VNVFDHPTTKALVDAALAEPGDADRQLVLRDWLMDCGEAAVADEAVFTRRLSEWDVWNFGFGFGSGFGSGIGSGIGIGSGSGSGSGIGSGRGSGSGSGIGSGEPYEAKQMEPGKCYLVHCGDWHTLVGRCVRQVGPMTYLFESVSKIAETNNGDCWHQLAAGDKRLRKAATYQHYTTPCPIPLTIFATEWVGELPQEV